MNASLTKTVWIGVVLTLGCSGGNGQTADAMKGSSGTGGDTGAAGMSVDAGANAGHGGSSSGGQGGTGGRASGMGGQGGTGGRAAGTGGQTAGTGGQTAGTGGNGDDMATGGKGGQSCPPECLRAYECAASCDDTPVNNGCCPCPDGTIDVITCPAKGSASGYCGLQCSGAAPSPEVVQACNAFTGQKDCVAYRSDKFPYQCAWIVPPVAPCLAP